MSPIDNLDNHYEYPKENGDNKEELSALDTDFHNTKNPDTSLKGNGKNNLSYSPNTVSNPHLNDDNYMGPLEINENNYLDNIISNLINTYQNDYDGNDDNYFIGNPDEFKNFIYSDLCINIINDEYKNFSGEKRLSQGTFNHKIYEKIKIQRELKNGILDIKQAISKSVALEVNSILQNFENDAINEADDIKRYAMLNKVVQNISCSIFNDKESKRYIQKLLKEEMKILVSKDVDNDFDLHKISDIETINSIKIKAYLIILLEDPNFSTDNPNFEEQINQVIHILLMSDDKLANIKNRFSQREREQREWEAKETETRKQRIAERKKILQLNNYSHNTMWLEPLPYLNDGQDGTINIQTATGSQIARREKLGEKLINPKNHKFVSEEMLNKRKHQAFQEAFDDFLLKSEFNISKQDIESMLFDFDNLTINENNVKIFFEKSFALGDLTDKELSKQKTLLFALASNVNNRFETLESEKLQAGTKKEIIKNDKAAGIVIDQIKNIFSNLNHNDNTISANKLFWLDNNEPVIINGDNMIITGKFNDTDIFLRYNLSSGVLFTNSFIGKGKNGGLTVKNTNTDYKLGNILPFSTILEEMEEDMTETDSTDQDITSSLESKVSLHKGKGLHHHGGLQHIPNKISQSHFNESLSPLGIVDTPEKLSKRLKLNIKMQANLDVIPSRLQKHIETESVKSTTINAFLKTFNLYDDKRDNIEYVPGVQNNIFNLVQIFNNSDAQVFKAFEANMQEILKYSGLKRGVPNLIQDKNIYSTKLLGIKTSSNSRDLNIENAMFLKNMMFESNNNITDNSLNYTGYLGIAQLIIEKFTDGEPPAQTLSIIKMTNFVNSFKTGLTYAQADNELEKKLKDF